MQVSGTGYRITPSTLFYRFCANLTIYKTVKRLMNVQIKALSHDTLKFYKSLPSNFAGPRLPGGEILSASGEFGDLCVQEFNGDNFIIRYSVFQTNEPLTIDAKSHHSGMHVIIMLRNAIQLFFENAGNIEIAEGQFTMVQAAQPSAVVNFQGRQQFVCFEALLTSELALTLFNDFSELDVSFQKTAIDRPSILIKPARWADHEVRDQIHYILTYSDQVRWRRNYFENRVRDILWKLLAIYLRQPLAEMELTETEKEKAYKIQQLILERLDEHLLISELAKKVTASESKIKSIFKKVFGKGIHEYRTAERLKKAIQLINEGKSVKEAAALTGWRSADLGKAYYKVYGTTPGTIIKRRK